METFRTSDGSLTLHSARYAEGYRSRHGALSEARHVFLAGSGLAARLAAGDSVAVLEVGFGTGLNFLATACAALAARGEGQDDGPRLVYTALENDPPPLAALRELGYDELLAPCTAPRELLAGLTSLGEPLPAGRTRLGLGDPVTVTLDLVIGDARLFEPKPRGYDAIYLDPFSPKANPTLWTSEFLATLAVALAPGGRLVSYSVSGEVRRNLATAGLDVRKVPGPPGGKREVLTALKPAP